jgi:hypothetical protein
VAGPQRNRAFTIFGLSHSPEDNLGTMEMYAKYIKSWKYFV